MWGMLQCNVRYALHLLPCQWCVIHFHVFSPPLHPNCSDNDIDGVFDQTFSVDHDRFGRITHHDLKPNGQEIKVTNENKKEYVRLYVQWRFRVGVEKQFMALQRGFHELVPPHLLKLFDEKELELIISGLGSVDVEDWKVNTRLKHCTSSTSVVKWFWKVSGEMCVSSLLCVVLISGKVLTSLFPLLCVCVHV